MKTQKKLNLVLIVLIILLLSIVSFGGIYIKDKSNMKNILPSYKLGNDLKGYRQVNFVVEESNDESQDTKKYEAGDYRKAADIFKKRLNSLKIDNYTVSCDEYSGKIVITLPEDDKTDTILSDLAETGKFSIVDSTTNEELLNNKDVKSVKVGVQQGVSSAQMYMSINFNTKGSSKFAQITKNYQNTVEENTVQNESSENASNEAETENNEESTSEEKSSKQVTLKVDDADLMTTDFSQVIDNGVLTLTLGTSSTSTEIDQTQLDSAANLAAIIENEALPVDYKVDSNTYIGSVVDTNTIKGIICIEVAIALVIALVIIVKFRLNGLFATILSIGYVAITLICVRLANVTISLEGIIAVLLSYVANILFSVLLLKDYKNSLSKKDKTRLLNNVIKKYTLVLIPELLISIVCCFTIWVPLFSFGMVMFWGLIISWIYNVVISKIIL